MEPSASADANADDSEVNHSVTELVRKISAEPNNNARSSEALPLQSVVESQKIVSQESMQAGLTDREPAKDAIQPLSEEDTVENESPVRDTSEAVEPVSAKQVRPGGLLMGLVRRFFSWVRRIVRL